MPDTHKPDDTPTDATDSSRGAVGPSIPPPVDVNEHTAERDDPPDPSEVEPTDNSVGAAIDLGRLEEIEEFGGEG
jgi:hypothetical protein